MSKRDLRPTQPHVQCVLGFAYPGVKRPRPEAGNSSPFNANIKNESNSTSTFHICLSGVFREDYTLLVPVTLTSLSSVSLILLRSTQTSGFNLSWYINTVRQICLKWRHTVYVNNVKIWSADIRPRRKHASSKIMCFHDRPICVSSNKIWDVISYAPP
jgi:hypothetical protein